MEFMLELKKLVSTRLVTGGSCLFSPKDVKRGITSTLREINKIHANGITKSEWQRFSDILKTGERLTYDSLTSSTVLVHNNLLLGRNWLEYQDYRQRLYHCTLKEVNQTLKNICLQKNYLSVLPDQ